MAHYDIDYRCLFCGKYMFSAMPNEKVQESELFCNPTHRTKYYSKSATAKREKKQRVQNA